jgi:hypothetical protein
VSNKNLGERPPSSCRKLPKLPILERISAMTGKILLLFSRNPPAYHGIDRLAIAGFSGT